MSLAFFWGWLQRPPAFFYDFSIISNNCPVWISPRLSPSQECQSTHVNKNGQKKGKQNYICVGCGRQFIDCYQPHKGYSEEVKRECLKMYVNGMGFRAIERVKNVHHTTIINWVKQVGKLLPNYYDPDPIPEVGELDELGRDSGI